MNEQEFMERMKRAKSKVKDGLFTPIVDMLSEDREYASVKIRQGTMNKEETRTRIGQRVKALRLLADLSQDELAQRAGLQRTHIGRIEGGKYAVNIETLQAIAEALGMTVDIIDPGLQDLAPLKRLT